MPVQRKVFRIEQMLSADGAAAALPGISGSEQIEILAELKTLQDLVARQGAGAKADVDRIDAGELRSLRDDTGAIQFALNRTKHELAALHVTALGEARPTRMIRQVDAIAEDAERATRQILDAAEVIDDAANTLATSLKHEYESSLALDIQDNVLRIFEACSFQDLSGQRLAKVLAMLKFIEQRIDHMVAVWGGIQTLKSYAGAAAEHEDAVNLCGPKLDGDEGHATQDEVDAMFRADTKRA